jgi:hypothetical protein
MVKLTALGCDPRVCVQARLSGPVKPASICTQVWEQPQQESRKGLLCVMGHCFSSGAWVHTPALLWSQGMRT